jgi:uncharacterized LabA/DUF88 family protein
MHLSTAIISILLSASKVGNWILADGRVKGNVDAELVLHAMIEYPHYYNAVIVTGDGDYFCLLDYLRKQHKLRKLIVPDRNRYSSLLRKFAADMVFMNDLKSKLDYRGHK